MLPTGTILWCDVSTDSIRPYIPEAYRKEVFQQMHNMSHPGIKNTVKLMTSKFVWRDIKKDISLWAKTCLSCQKNKVHRHTKSPLANFQQLDERFSTIHVDLIGPLPPSNGFTYCLTCIDRHTSWVEVIPVRDVTAATIAKAFYDNWVCRFGVPALIITDRGVQFESTTFRKLADICGSVVRHTTAYHPQCNGKIERQHRTIKAAIRAHSSLSWSEVLSTVLMGMRAALFDDLGYTTSAMVYGKTIRLPGEFFTTPKSTGLTSDFLTHLQTSLDQVRPSARKQNTQHKSFVHEDLSTASHVFVRVDRVKKFFETPYDGPYAVLHRSAKYFSLQIKGNSVNVSIDRLKPAYLLQEAEPQPSTGPVQSKSRSRKVQFQVPSPDVSQPKTTQVGRPVRLPQRYKV